MFLQLLVSELQKVPDINHDLIVSENKAAAIKDPQTVSDIEELFFLREKKFEFENLSHTVSLHQLEDSFIKAKHFQTEGSEEEIIFV